MVGQGREHGPPASMLAVLGCVCLVGVFDGMAQGAVFGEAAQLTPQIMHVSSLEPYTMCIVICGYVQQLGAAGHAHDS